jgi:hypothetical protein
LEIVLFFQHLAEIVAEPFLEFQIHRDMPRNP